MTTIYEEYLSALAAADANAAVALLQEALSRGESPRWLLTDVLARGQSQVGQLWQEGRWDIADEHAATAVAEQALPVLAPVTGRDPAARRVVLACAEGEWHTMPARLAGELARHGDLDVAMLGGSMPAAQLQRYLAATAPAALALSVTLTTNLVAATRSIEAAHAEGVPVVVGGAAWGAGQLRARRLGADLRLEDPADLRLVLDGLVPGRWADQQHRLPAEVLVLDTPPEPLLQLAVDRHEAAGGWVRRLSTYQRRELRSDYEWLARHAAAAVACRDRTILRSHLSWLMPVLTQRGMPLQAIPDSCHFLAESVGHHAPLAADMLRAEAGLFRADLARAEA